MDADAALTVVNRYIDLIDERYNAIRGGANMATLPKYDEQITELSVQMATLASGPFPGMTWTKLSSDLGRWNLYRDNAIVYRGWLTTSAETARILGPTGPQLSATSLHPVVWNAALPLWNSGHHWEAVRNAGEQLTPHLQAKLGRFDLSGTDLVGQAFSLNDPTTDAPRLRFTQYTKGTDEWRSAHAGALAFGQGCMMAIRNLSTHTNRDADQQRALEELAALSVFARMVDSAEVAS